MNYDQFVKKAEEMGTGLINLLPTYYKKFDDETMYPPTEIAEKIISSAETVRRWIRNEEIPYEGVTHYYINGLEVKRFLFIKYRKKLPKTIKQFIKHYENNK
jgi:hypothetical protein